MRAGITGQARASAAAVPGAHSATLRDTNVTICSRARLASASQTMRGLMRTSLNRQTESAAAGPQQAATIGVVPAQGTRQADLPAYRRAVRELLEEADGVMASGRLRALQTLTAERLVGGQFGGVLSAVPGGLGAAVDGLMREISGYRPAAQGFAAGMSAV